ncbi:hypothetical protein SDC9_187660 [bioreactor metagenome]|uniref:Uncharacterized protein n=1 Tax=bioreactor metagenome TaxID=1076179 RepID=A0A645HVD3_9ZZZZ
MKTEGGMNMNGNMKQIVVACAVLAVFIVSLILYSTNTFGNASVDLIYIIGSVILLYASNIYVKKKIDRNPRIYTRTLYIGLIAIILFGIARNLIGF